MITTTAPMTLSALHFQILEITGYRSIAIGTETLHVTDALCVDLETGDVFEFSIPTEEIRFAGAPATAAQMAALSRAHRKLTHDQDATLSARTCLAIAHLIPGLDLPDTLTAERAAEAIVETIAAARR